MDIFGGNYDALYERGKQLLEDFNKATKLELAAATRQTCVSRVRTVESTTRLPQSDDERAIARLALWRIVDDPGDPDSMEAVTAWLSTKFPLEPSGC